MHSSLFVLVTLACIATLVHSSCYTTLPPNYLASDEVPSHLQWARLLLDNIPAGSPLTAYKNNNITVWWDTYSCDPSYLSITDCSGLITALLDRSYNLSITSGHAYAFLYGNAIENQTNGFLNIQNIADAQVGDILTIRYYYDPTMTGPHDTGHMGIVNSPPFILTPTDPIIPNTVQWAFPLLDQTSTPHTPNDSRSAVGGKGLGTGTLRVYVNESSGFVEGYTWSLNTSSPFINQSYNALFVGRLNSTYLSIFDNPPSDSTPSPSPTPSSSPAPSSTTSSSESVSTTSSSSFLQPVAFIAVVAILLIFLW